MMRITVLTGGSTPERDVAFAGAGQVVRALRQRGHDVAVVDTVGGPLDAAAEHVLLEPGVGKYPPSVVELRALAEREHLQTLTELPELRSADVVFLVLHGMQGEGGEIQTLLESGGISYTGSGPLASGLAMDKDIAKRLFRAAGIPTPDWEIWPVTAEAVTGLGFPLVVKPSKVGSSVGLSVIDSRDGLETAVSTALQYDDEVMLEQFVAGPEYTVGVLDDKALAVGEIIPQHSTFDYECKYTPGKTQEIFPAQIPDELTILLQTLAVRAHKALKLGDFSRVDFKVAGDGDPQCLEVNTLPGLTATSLLPQSAAACGIEFAELCEAICRAAIRRAQRGNKAGT
jgi:D-alanine-D-alanine ligase